MNAALAYSAAELATCVGVFATINAEFAYRAAELAT